MKVIRARNVHQALPSALYLLGEEGVDRESRNGPVVMFREPVATVYARPAERAVFWAGRDANPFFHLMESLWMLGGRNDVEYVAHYVERMRSFSDDGVTLHGAYGHRWRCHFDYDQLAVIINSLKENPDDRRQVLSMWDARVDLGRPGKDLPCNLQALFQINDRGQLAMMVTNRSNDMIWGAYGANAVHFSILHEYVARSIGVEQGPYYQVSFNFHAYRALLTDPAYADLAIEAGCEDPLVPAELRWANTCPYAAGTVEPFPLMSIDRTDWDNDLQMFLDHGHGVVGLRDRFFRRVAVPMAVAHAEFRRRSNPHRFEAALEALEDVKASDWALACREWIERRRFAAQQRASEVRQQRAQDDGVSYE